MLFPRWFNKIILLAAAFLLPFTALAQSFTDVSRNYKNHEAISYLSDLGIINGYQDGSFQPQRAISRAEAIKLLIAANFDETSIQHALDEHRDLNHWYATFYDVLLTDWHAAYVSLAFQYGIVAGYPDGSFRPNEILNFAEGLKVILETYDVDLRQVQFTERPLLYIKKDDWFSLYFEYAYNKNLINREKFYHPVQPITRGEFAEILYRLKTIQEKGLDQFVETRKPYSNEYAITIPRLNLININVSFADPYNATDALSVLKDGLGHYLSPPGSGRKMVLFGHSSGYNWDSSGFKQILRQMDRLEVGDLLYINYQEKGYVYQINKKEVIPAKQLVSVMEDYNYEELAMYTCWPPDSISHRYVVYATPL